MEMSRPSFDLGHRPPSLASEAQSAAPGGGLDIEME